MVGANHLILWERMAILGKKLFPDVSLKKIWIQNDKNMMFLNAQSKKKASLGWLNSQENVCLVQKSLSAIGIGGKMG